MQGGLDSALGGARLLNLNAQKKLMHARTVVHSKVLAILQNRLKKGRKIDPIQEQAGCNAIMYTRTKDDKTWIVSRVIEEHNHPLVTPTKRHKLRSSRKIAEEQERVFQNMQLAGIKTNLMMRYMGTEVGGSCNACLKIFVVMDVLHLPHQYILKRWTRDAKSGSVTNKEGWEIVADCHRANTSRFSSLCFEAVNIATKGATSIKVYKIAMSGFHQAKMLKLVLRRLILSPIILVRVLVKVMCNNHQLLAKAIQLKLSIGITRNNTTVVKIIRVMVCAMVYDIWSERNNRRFKGKQHTALHVAWDTSKKMKNYLQQVLMKISDSDETRRMCVGYGGMIRDKDGNAFLTYNNSSKYKSTLLQELLGITEGIKAVSMIGIRETNRAAAFMAKTCNMSNHSVNYSIGPFDKRLSVILVDDAN
ncbi:hypothetical protein IFM89_010601, partial [Coptis chinensis]